MRWIGKQIVLTGLVFVLCWAPMFILGLGAYMWLEWLAQGVLDWKIYIPAIFTGTMLATFCVAVNFYRKVRRW